MWESEINAHVPRRADTEQLNGNRKTTIYYISEMFDVSQQYNASFGHILGSKVKFY
jgi:hypothetical protein